MRIRDIHPKNACNIYERLNGGFKDRIKTARGFKIRPNKKTD